MLFRPFVLLKMTECFITNGLSFTNSYEWSFHSFFNCSVQCIILWGIHIWFFFPPLSFPVLGTELTLNSKFSCRMQPMLLRDCGWQRLRSTRTLRLLATPLYFIQPMGETCTASPLWRHALCWMCCAHLTLILMEGTVLTTLTFPFPLSQVLGSVLLLDLWLYLKLGKYFWSFKSCLMLEPFNRNKIVIT